MNPLIHLLLSFQGRINRALFWRGLLMLLLLEFGVASLINPALFDFSTDVVVDEQPVETFWHAAMVYPWTALSVKRFNDRDWPFWVGYAVGAIMLVVALAPLAGLANGDPAAWNALEWTLIGAVAVVGIASLIDNGFLRGSQGPNRHGPDPLAAATA